jgi:hypothetical protein
LGIIIQLTSIQNSYLHKKAAPGAIRCVQWEFVLIVFGVLVGVDQVALREL